MRNLVDQSVVVEEESAGDVECDEDIDSVMLVHRQDEDLCKSL